MSRSTHSETQAAKSQQRSSAPSLNNLESESQIESATTSSRQGTQIGLPSNALSTAIQTINNPIDERQSTSVFAKLCSCLNLFRVRRSNVNSESSSVNESVISDFCEGGASSCEPVRIPDRCQEDKSRKTLVLDLDETLVTSSCLEFANADLKIKIQLEGGNEKNVWMKFRPGVNRFLNELSEIYEIIIFTASIKEYANVVIDFLDTENVVDFRVFRENCSIDEESGQMFKDLSLLNRNMNEIIIIDNQANQFKRQPENGIQISDFKIDGSNDRALLELLPFLRLLSSFSDVRPVSSFLKAYNESQLISYVDINGMPCEFTRGIADQYDEDRLRTEMSESRIDEIDLEQMNDDDNDEGIESKKADRRSRRQSNKESSAIVIPSNNRRLSSTLANSNHNNGSPQSRSNRRVGDIDHMRSASQRISILQPIEISHNNKQIEEKQQGGFAMMNSAKGNAKQSNGTTKSLFDFAGFKSSVYNKINSNGSTANSQLKDQIAHHSNTASMAAAAAAVAAQGKENMLSHHSRQASKSSAFQEIKTKKQQENNENKVYMEIQETVGDQNNNSISAAKNMLFDTSASQNDQLDNFISKPRVYTKPHRRCASQQIKFATLSLKDENFHSPMAKEI